MNLLADLMRAAAPPAVPPLVLPAITLPAITLPAITLPAIALPVIAAGIVSILLAAAVAATLAALLTALWCRRSRKALPAHYDRLPRMADHLPVLITDVDRAAVGYIGMVEDVTEQQRLEQQRLEQQLAGRSRAGQEVQQQADLLRNVSDMVAVNRDITERKRMEEQLKLLARVIEQSSVALTIMDTDGVIFYANPWFTQQTGFTLDEVRGKRLRVLDQKPLSAVGRQLWDALRTGTEWRGELRSTTKDGRTYWEGGLVTPVFDENGRITHFMAVMEDITQLKQRQREQEAMLAVATALRAVNNRSEMLSIILQQVCGSLEATLAFYVAPDPPSGDMVVEAACKDGREYRDLGLRTPPNKGISAHVLHTNQPHRTDDVWADPLLATPTLISEERAAAAVPLLTQGGTIGVLWAARMAPLEDNDLRLLSAIADMTAAGLQRAALYEQSLRYAADLEQEVAARTHDLREANQRLQELDGLKSKFVSDVSHELRTPITNIGLYLDLMNRRPEKREHYLGVLREQAGRLEQLVTQVLDLARLDNTRQLARAPVDLNEVLQAVVTVHEAKAEVQGITLCFERDRAPCWVRGDRARLVQVATNLVINALNYTRAGQVCVRSARSAAAGTVQFSVEDTGVGIYPEDLPHLFERFYRGRRDQGADAPGAGLGLVIVKELLDLHGGSISVQSEAGQGSVFTVTLPAAGEAAGEAGGEAAGEAAEGNGAIENGAGKGRSDDHDTCDRRRQRHS